MEQQKSTFEKYAIIETGGKQYQAIEGKTIQIEKLEGEVGSTVEFKALLKKSGENLEVGKPYIETPVKASIVKNIRGPKLIVFKFKRRKKVRVKKGHRQNHTVVRIESI